MPYLFVGAGQAGSAIVDEVFEHKNIQQIAQPIVFNSTIRDLQNLSNISQESWYGVAEQYGLVEGGTAGFEERVTGGFGRNPVKADEVMSGRVPDIEAAIDEQLGGETEPEEAQTEATEQADIPFAFIFVGLGGGTGCGIAPYIADAIANYTNDIAQIIAVCVLPNTQGPVGGDSDTEATPSRQAWNTRYGLNRIKRVVQGIIFVDNQRLAYHNAAEGQFTEYNEFIASGIVDLISGPILERIDRSEYEVDPPIIDLQDIVTSLSLGGADNRQEPGYASLCRSVLMTKTLPGYLLPVVGKQNITATDLWDRARLKQTIEDVDLDDTQKAIGLLRAPSRYIRDNEYRIDTSKFRSSLTAHCNEVNLGVTLTNRNLASFTSLLTFAREDVSRVQEINELAEEYEQTSAPSGASGGVSSASGEEETPTGQRAEAADAGTSPDGDPRRERTEQRTDTTHSQT